LTTDSNILETATTMDQGTDEAMSSPMRGDKGGIDLTSANKSLQTQNAGEAIKFHFDPALLAQLQNAPGFVPVIIRIQPLMDLRKFLDNVETPFMASL